MCDVQYFVMTDDPARAEERPAVILRLEDGAPWALAEAVRTDGMWRGVDWLARYHLRGTSDQPITEVSAGRATQILLAQQRRSTTGRILPDPLPGEPGSADITRTPAEAERHAALVAEARREQDRVYAVYARVPTPHGAADVRARRGANPSSASDDDDGGGSEPSLRIV